MDIHYIKLAFLDLGDLLKKITKEVFTMADKYPNYEYSYRLWNPDHPDGFYQSSDCVEGETWCSYCGGLTKKPTLEEHYKDECESYGGKT